MTSYLKREPLRCPCRLSSLAPVARLAVASCVALACHQPGIAGTPLRVVWQSRIRLVDADSKQHPAPPTNLDHPSGPGEVARRVGVYPRDRIWSNNQILTHVRFSRIGGLYGP